MKNKGIKRRTYPRNIDYHFDAEYSEEKRYRGTQLSRYNTYRTIENEIYQPLELKLINGITRASKYLGSYREVTLREQNRLDVIAEDEYGDQRLFWVIALANDILDPFNVKKGTILKIPQISVLHSRGGYFDV